MTGKDDATRWLSNVRLDQLLAMLRDNGVTEVLYKVLPKNANSKNQVYLAPDLSWLGKIPSGEITAHASTSRKRGGEEAVFRSALDFHWLGENGATFVAPDAKLIFYPQYPEVRFSGFLKGCRNAPSALYDKDRRGQEPDRILVLGLGNGRKVIAVTLPPESPAAREIRSTEPHEAYGVFGVLPIWGEARQEGYFALMRALCAIHRLDWVPSTRLDPKGALVPCNSSNCNGNTLESLLGIRSNGYSLPDFRGWEVKARQVSNVNRPGYSTVTLFTPEPVSGFYRDAGVQDFLRRYGYPDTKGRADRLNFGGIYRAGATAHARTGLRLVLDGFDAETRNYRSDGAIQLLDACDNIAAAWPFSKLMDHWKTKHAQAAFVPAQQQLLPKRRYKFGRQVLLGQGAQFGLLLKAVHDGGVYYDPGIKLENIHAPSPKAKKRSQFRVTSSKLAALYESATVVDVCDEAAKTRL